MSAGEIRWNIKAKKFILLKSNNISANIDSEEQKGSEKNKRGQPWRVEITSLPDSLSSCSPSSSSLPLSPPCSLPAPSS